MYDKKNLSLVSMQNAFFLTMLLHFFIVSYLTFVTVIFKSLVRTILCFSVYFLPRGKYIFSIMTDFPIKRVFFPYKCAPHNNAKSNRLLIVLRPCVTYLRDCETINDVQLIFCVLDIGIVQFYAAETHWHSLFL